MPWISSEEYVSFVKPRAMRRWPYVGVGQKRLLFAALATIAGSILPWLDTAFGTFYGLQTFGLWSFYVGFFGLGGAFMPWRKVAIGHGVVLSLGAVGAPAYQLVHMLRFGGFGRAWLPGWGLVIVAAAGVAAVYATKRMYDDRHEPVSAKPAPTDAAK